MDSAIGKWYFVRLFKKSWGFDDRVESELDMSEVVFIKPGESIAKYTRKKCLAHTYYDECGHRGMPQGDTCLIRELSLLLPNGNKITGFKPDSLKKFFMDSETTVGRRG